jgi:pyruvate formate lyase activating enzyme
MRDDEPQLVGWISEAHPPETRGEAAQPPSALGPRPSALSIGGLTPLTTIDYPDALAAVVFCLGCPWRCRYCHNPHLAQRENGGGMSWSEVVSFLERRRGLLDAVVFSGGEPTVQGALADAMAVVRALGFRVGLHTAGCYPDRLQQVLPLVDWVGLDIKALPERYAAITGVPGSGDAAWRSLDLLVGSRVDHEVRITVHGVLLSRVEVDRVVDRVRLAGAREIVLQKAGVDDILDPTLGPNTARWIDAERTPIFYKGVTSRRLAG